MVAPFVAARAYAAVQAQATGVAQQAQALGPGSAISDPHSFEAVLKNAMTDALQTSRVAETQMQAQAQGKGNLVDVVTAVASAETSLQTVMAVRDQVIAAYQQVMQMPI